MFKKQLTNSYLILKFFIFANFYKLYNDKHLS